MKICKKIMEAKKELTNSFLKEKKENPYTFYFQEKIPGKKHKITVEEIEENHFYDENGFKWVREEKNS